MINAESAEFLFQNNVFLNTAKSFFHVINDLVLIMFVPLNFFNILCFFQ